MKHTTENKLTAKFGHHLRGWVFVKLRAVSDSEQIHGVISTDTSGPENDLQYAAPHCQQN